ncbi:hypothetical protein, partial [Bradyrhizobium canariense]|uniref:hypothetical protein n=1 Tax=Bradyrhizobium canariense TaxID=255045 RepID=UPI001AECF4B8
MVSLVAVQGSGTVKGFGCRPHDGVAARTGAGVRKPPKEMLWGGDEDIASIVADEPMERPMQKLNDLSRSSSPLDPNGTL